MPKEPARLSYSWKLSQNSAGSMINTHCKPQSALVNHSFGSLHLNQAHIKNTWNNNNTKPSVLSTYRHFFLAFIPQTTQCNNYLHSIYCVFRILSHLEMIWSILDGMGRFHANTMSLYTYIKNLCIHGFRYLWGCPEPNPLQRPKEVFFRF